MKTATVQIETKGLDQIVKALKGQLPGIRIGILQNTARSKGKETNASIGAKHELGEDGMPPRSFLRIPLIDNLNEYLTKSNALNKEVLAHVVREGSILPWMKIVATQAENIVQDGFDSGGFGKWAKWKTPGYTNNTGMILVDTRDLRNSITSEVK